MGLKEIRWLALGFVAATLAAAAVESRAASAQTATDRSRPDDLTFPGEAGRPTRGPGAEPDLGDSEDAESAERDPDDTSRPRSGQRAVIVDGDQSYPAEPAAPVDGMVDNAEPEPPLDGADPSAIDMRSPEEIGIFENPPAGHDPLLFQIEDLSPVLDRRPERLFRFEPYDPVGIRLGSFVYFPEAEINGASFSNVFASPNAEDDVAAEIRTRSRLVSNWKVHALELNSTSFWSFYDQFDSENDKAYSVGARGRLDITRRTDLQAAVNYDHAQEDRGAIDASTAGERPDIDTLRGELALRHRMNRLETRLRASITDTDIGESEDGFGFVFTNEERDAVINEQAVRLTYDLKPSFAVFTEAGLNQREYKTAPLSDGLLRDGDGQRYRLGLDFGEEGQILRGEISIGYGIQDHDTQPLQDVEAFLFDSNVTYRFNELTAFRLLARTEIGDTTTADASGVVTQSVGVEARHAFRRYFIGTAGITFANNDYAGIDLTEDEIRLNLEAEYYASRELVLFSRYQHVDFNSSEPDADWQSDEFRVGLRMRR